MDVSDGALEPDATCQECSLVVVRALTQPTAPDLSLRHCHNTQSITIIIIAVVVIVVVIIIIIIVVGA